LSRCAEMGSHAPAVSSCLFRTAFREQGRTVRAGEKVGRSRARTAPRAFSSLQGIASPSSFGGPLCYRGLRAITRRVYLAAEPPGTSVDLQVDPDGHVWTTDSAEL